MSNIPPPPPVTQGPGAVTPVENGTRFAAFLLEVLLTIATCGIGWIIWSVVLWPQSTTPAKKLMKLKVVDTSTGAPAVMQQMVMRELVGKIAIGWGGNVAAAWVLSNSSMNVGALLYIASGIMILVNANRQGVWDYIAKTTVVRAG